MKYINIYYLVFALLLVGCNDDFLDRYPETQINDGNFFKSESDLKIYNNGLYSSYFLREGFQNQGAFNAEVLTFDKYSDNAFMQTPDDIRLGINSANQPGFQEWDWSLVRDINQFLENASSADVEEVVRNRYIAEARLIRALEYYDKVKLYGDLPIIDRVLAVDDELLTASQSPRDEVMEFINDDLDFAVQWLPTSAEENRFNKYIAAAYKARIMLHEGTFRKYHSLGQEKTYLQQAAIASQLVMDSDDYMIDPSVGYGELFSNLNLSGNKEIVFFKDYEESLQLYHNVGNILTHVNGAEFGGSKSLINDYLALDGLPIEESDLYEGDETIEKEFANRDLRLRETFGIPNSYFIGDKIYLNSDPNGIVNTGTPSGYQLVKFYNEEQDPLAWNRNFIDAPLIRYAEVLLINAEAKAELQTITQNDIDNTVNLLRVKAGVADLTLSGGIIEDIRRERRVELAFEGFRYDDLMRWKQGSLLAEPVLGLKFNDTDIADADAFEVGTDIQLNNEGYIISDNVYSFDESKNYYFPIPVNELSLNPNLEQTPGW
ncbi:RagB/SusD family nutrient uptake outer membrane protein [Joostella sp.]|uniref:RagB/SusD family nutrient uptake outer membrane protein n=1 Tax=Joostella sp. TaxID=2231138 RepID=UPI003A8F602B